jgi:hypothetical protein
MIMSEKNIVIIIINIREMLPNTCNNNINNNEPWYFNRLPDNFGCLRAAHAWDFLLVIPIGRLD